MARVMWLWQFILAVYGPCVNADQSDSGLFTFSPETGENIP